MRLFGKKKSNTAIREDPPPPTISRPRAQGHLPPTTAPKPSSSSRRSTSSNNGPPGSEPMTTPLYARFARADSFENLSLRAKNGADSRAPSYAPTQQELEEDAKKLGYDRPWAQELLSSFDNPDPIQPAPTGTSSIRVVSNSTSPPNVRDRKTSVDKRISLEAVAAADPFMASKMQSIMRRAPSNVRVPDPAPNTPKRSVTAPPNGPTPTTSPPPRIPTAPPTRSVSAKSPGPKSPPSSRPSFDDDEMSTFSHSHTGHQTQPRPVYPSISSAAAAAKRERGPPPVAGTPSAYAWKSGQSDDGHGGSNFYTGGSQQNTSINSFFPPAQPNSSSLPPGAAPPDPRGLNNAGPIALKKRTPSNPPTNRTPAPAGTGNNRRMSMDGTNARPLSGGPGTWGGSAIAGGKPNGPPSSYGVPNATYGDLSRTPTVRSVQPGEIFHHPGTMPPPSSVSAPYQAVSPPPPPAKTVSPPAPMSPPRQISSSIPPRQVTSPGPSQPQPLPQPQPTPPAPQRQATSPPPAPPKKPTPALPPGAAPRFPLRAQAQSDELWADIFGVWSYAWVCIWRVWRRWKGGGKFD
ncbi:hypothetical protein OPQ81_000309 [Rhizoctonia solani]|nr:hypothetical protein OPQ81_000309 [Rhizoctonia solani]